MLQEVLFHESILDALRAVVERAGGAKAVGLKLRPSKSADEAGRWVLDCLNASRPERFAPDDVLFLLKIGRENEFHGAMQYLANECGYDVRPIEPADEHAKLQWDYIEAVKLQAKIAARLEKLALPTIKAVA